HRRRLLVPGAAQGALAVFRSHGAGSDFEHRGFARREFGAAAGHLAGLLWRRAYRSRCDVRFARPLDGNLISPAGSLGGVSSGLRRTGTPGRRLWPAAHHLWRLHTLEARWLSTAALPRPLRPISTS